MSRTLTDRPGHSLDGLLTARFTVRIRAPEPVFEYESPHFRFRRGPSRRRAGAAVRAAHLGPPFRALGCIDVPARVASGGARMVKLPGVYCCGVDSTRM